MDNSINVLKALAINQLETNELFSVLSGFGNRWFVTTTSLIKLTHAVFVNPVTTTPSRSNPNSNAH